MKAKSFILFGLFFLTCSGNVFLSKDGTEGDIKEKQWAIQMEPDNPLNYIALGNIYLESMRYDEAIAQFNKALELSPGLNPGLLQKGIALWRKQDKKAALNAFKSVLYSPKQENLHIQIAHELGCPFQVDRISHGNGEYAFPAPSPVRDELLCQSTRDGNWELYLLDFTGQVIKRVTDNYARDESPVFAPDGKTFAFTSTRDDSLHTSFEKICRNIYLGNIESGSVTPLVSDPSDDWSPVFSPDGEKVLFLSDRDCDENCNNLLEIDLKTSQVRKLYSDYHFFLGDYYSRDMVFLSHDAEGLYHIFQKSLSASGEKSFCRNFSQQVGVRLFGQKKLTFFSNRENQYDIYTGGIDSGECLKLTCHPAIDAFPDFSHDGTKIFFHSNREDNRYQIYAIDLTRQVSYDHLIEVVRDMDF